jgi:hypothetical protein
MSALVLEALALAEQHNITVAVVGDDRLSWESRGPTPGKALKALRAAKGELIGLLVRYQLHADGALTGDDLLTKLRALGLMVRRYGVNAAIDDDRGGALDRAAPSLLLRFADRQAEYGLALRALRAPDRLAGLETDETDDPKTATDERLGAVAKARDLIEKLRGFGFRAWLDRGALYFVDTTGLQRDFIKSCPPSHSFAVINAALGVDPDFVGPPPVVTVGGRLRRRRAAPAEPPGLSPGVAPVPETDKPRRLISEEERQAARRWCEQNGFRPPNGDWNYPGALRRAAAIEAWLNGPGMLVQEERS